MLGAFIYGLAMQTYDNFEDFYRHHNLDEAQQGGEEDTDNDEGPSEDEEETFSV